MSKNILLVYTNYSSFVKADYEILSESNHVDRYQFRLHKKLFPFVWQFLKQLSFLLFKGWKYDVFFIWFSDYHAFLPALFAKVFSKKSVIVVGGYDAASFPTLDYGVFLKKGFRSYCAGKSYLLAFKIIPVSACLVKSTNTFVDPPHRIDLGILHFVEGIENKTEVVHTGYDASKWKPREEEIKSDLVVTVCAVEDERTFLVKGLDLFLETARLLTQYDFEIVGLKGEMFNKVQSVAPPNLKCTGFLQGEALIHKFRQAKVYAQFSLTEGLPNAMCEAMLAECVPVGTRVGGIPELVEGVGILIDKKEPELAVKAIKLAFNLASEGDGKKARKKVETFFTTNCRKEKLYRIIN
jgi:glycosyltransferase involved in cell wall biosynthesis